MSVSTTSHTNKVGNAMNKIAVKTLTLVLAPLTVLLGIAAMEIVTAPSAEARAYICRPMPGGSGTFCSYGR